MQTDLPKKPVEMTDEDWKAILTPEQYRVLREKGTEAPFSGEYETEFRDGSYFCGACGEELFLSESKYDAGCGWPSFNAVADTEKVHKSEDRSFGMIRTEVTCENCGSHLGHVFPDQLSTTGDRFCINSAALKFKEKQKGVEKVAPQEE